MAMEIERKFLVRNDSWKAACIRSVKVRDGLIAGSDGRKARVRIIDGQGTLAVKGEAHGIVRAEFEYPIPTADAEEMLRSMCGDEVLEKTRYIVPNSGLTWEIDVYDGLLQGVVIAEVELRRENQSIVLPDWIGAEVTDDPNYKKSVMAARHRAVVRRQRGAVG
ncbi:MAG: CYTH domain-containing protein [Rhodopseudomonas sp.]|nr:CYTH domain-containing protein [Rhodopseudomonas sp.]